MKEDLLKKLEGTSLYEKIKETDELYKKIEEKEKKFCSAFNIHCKENCGSCCECFEPDVTELEALYLAYGLITDGKAEEILNTPFDPSDNGRHCPFYDEEKFCTVYEYRPLICRLFNACASNDKYGNPVFKPCKWNETENKITSEDFQKHPKDVITMEEFGEEMTDEESYDEKTVLLSDAVRRALEKILFILEMEEKEK